MSERRIQCPDELTQESGRALFEALRSEKLEQGEPVVLDFSGTQSMDSAGGAWLIKMADVANLCLFLLGPQSGVMTGALVDHDQNVMGAYD